MEDNELRDRLDDLEDSLEAKIQRVHDMVKTEYTLLELWRRTDKQLAWLFASVGGLVFTIVGAAILNGIFAGGN